MAAAPARAPSRRAPGRTARPARKPATRKSTGRPRPAAQRTPAARQPTLAGVPLAVGRTAVAVRGLPDSGLVRSLTRGRAWIGVLGVLLVGIVALNVASLTLGASTGQVEQQIMGLEQENSTLRSTIARRLSTERLESRAARLGLTRPGTEAISYVEADRDWPRQDARRLADAFEASGVATAD